MSDTPSFDQGYAPKGIHPVDGYGVLIGVFGALFAGFMAIVAFTDKKLPERLTLRDILLLGVGTYRVSRVLTKDSVTSVLRGHFTRFEYADGNGEVEEKPRGTGMRHAIGELVVCPYCVGQWVAAFAMYGFVLAPRVTRFIAGLYAIYTLSDYLNLAYTAAKRAVMQLPQQHFE